MSMWMWQLFASSPKIRPPTPFSSFLVLSILLHNKDRLDSTTQSYNSLMEMHPKWEGYKNVIHVIEKEDALLTLCGASAENIDNSHI
jgi:hypothetical protein